MDQSSIYLDCPTNYCYFPKGAKRVKVNTFVEGLWTLNTKLAAHARAKNTNLIIIPPRMTNLLQPADVCGFSEFKKAYHVKWVE